MENSIPEKNKGGRPRREDRISDPESMMTENVQESLRVLTKIRIKVEKLLSRVSESLDKHEENGDTSLEKQQKAMETLSATYKTLSDSTVNAVKALTALKKIQPSTTNNDEEILNKLFEDSESIGDNQ